MAKLMMYNGEILDIFNLKKENIDKEIIIRGACRINRFLGQTSYPYPVASHLLGGYYYLNSIGAELMIKKQWLIHEAFESFSGVDLPSPLKAMLPEYKKAEKRALIIIAEAFGVEVAESDEVKQLDGSIMVAEAFKLMPNREHWLEYAAQNNIEPLSERFVLSDVPIESIRADLDEAWREVFGS